MSRTAALLCGQPRVAGALRISTASCSTERAATARRHRRPLVVAAAGPALAELVANKEAHLAGLFTPGKPQPRAAQVAQLRKEIAELRSQLQEGLGGFTTLPARPAAKSPSPTAAPSLMAAAGTSGRVLNALKLVEANMAVSRTGRVGELSFEDQQTLLQLTDENLALKAKLDLILARQAQLQALADQHGGYDHSASTQPSFTSYTGNGSSASSTSGGGDSASEWLRDDGWDSSMPSGDQAAHGTPAATW